MYFFKTIFIPIYFKHYNDKFYYYRRNNEICNKISNLIVKDFPTECQSTYYVPPISKKYSLNKKSIPARGKLVNMWRNRDYENKKIEKQIDDDEADPENSHDEEGSVIIQKNILTLLNYQKSILIKFSIIIKNKSRYLCNSQNNVIIIYFFP